MQSKIDETSEVSRQSTVSFSKLDDAASYDAYAHLYGKYIELLSAPLAQEICSLAEMKQGDHVLDVACGTGVSSRAALQRVSPGGSVTAFDLSAGMIREAISASASDPIRYLVMDGEKIDFPDNSFDRVICLCGILHFPDFEKAITQMHRVLRRGGTLVLAIGQGRPFRLGKRIEHYCKRIYQYACRNYAFAPDLIYTQARIIKLAIGEETTTDWSKHSPALHIYDELSRQGFRDIRTSWRGHDVIFESPGEFWEAQIATVTPIRKALETQGPFIMEQLRTLCVKKATQLLTRGGTLVYPYGATYLVALKD